MVGQVGVSKIRYFVGMQLWTRRSNGMRLTQVSMLQPSSHTGPGQANDVGSVMSQITRPLSVPC